MNTDRWIISREEDLDARLEARIEAREQHEDEISDAREIEERGYEDDPPVNKTVLQTVWRRIRRPSRETIRRLTQ